MVVGTTTDVQPIVALDGRPIADGRPGPVTRRLQAAYTERLYG
jgi:D-alanine transaminase